jgi:hypothetical protein
MQKKYTLASFKKRLKKFSAHHITEPETEWVVKSLEIEDFHQFGLDRGLLKYKTDDSKYKTYYLTDSGWELIQKIQNTNERYL